MQPIHTERDIDQLRRSTYAYAVLLAWGRAGLFRQLAEGPRSAADLQGDPRAIQITAPILAGIGLLRRESDSWGLTRAGRALLEAGALPSQGTDDILGPLSRLDPVLVEGGPVKDPDGKPQVTEGGVREHDLESTRRFMDMLHRRSADDVVEVAELVAPHLPPGARVLDVGGGHGRYGDALVDRGFSVTLLDRGVCVDLARERYGDKLTYLSGDFMTDPLGGPYDAALLSNIVHGLGPGENLELLRRLADALAPGGIVVIKDMFLDEHFCQPEQAAVFGLTMLMYTREGQSYGRTEFETICGEAGLEPHDHVYLTDRGYSLLMVRKS